MAHSPKMPLKDLWNRDKRLCWLCGKYCKFADATRDHVVPVSLGGSDRQSNLRLAHQDCNAARGNQISDVMGSGALIAMQQKANRAKLAALLLSYRADVLCEAAVLIQKELGNYEDTRVGAEEAAELLERTARTLMPNGELS